MLTKCRFKSKSWSKNQTPWILHGLEPTLKTIFYGSTWTQTYLRIRPNEPTRVRPTLESNSSSHRGYF